MPMRDFLLAPTSNSPSPPLTATQETLKKHLGLRSDEMVDVSSSLPTSPSRLTPLTHSLMTVRQAVFLAFDRDHSGKVTCLTLLGPSLDPP